jgi:disulfide oxidoreductase YuzD
MIYCKELNKSFESKEDLFKALAENETLIVDAKKAQIYKSIDKGLQIVTDQNGIEKALSSEQNKGLKFDDNYYYFVVNSSNILDSHNDMHVDGNWKKTVKEQQGKVYLVFDHTLKRSEIIAMQKDIEMLTAKIPFSLLGKNYEGESYCLIYKVAKDKIVNKEAKQWLEDGHKLEASVRMQYVNIETAFNTNDKEYIKQKENYDMYYPLIANKSDFEEIEYFWIVKEAKNVYESSLVLFGSNGATGLIQENKNEADVITSEIKDEPLQDTQQLEVIPVKRKLSII